MTKKLYSIIAMFVVAAMLLVACGGGATPTEAPAAVTEAPTEAPMVTEAPTEMPTEAPMATEAPTEAPMATEAPPSGAMVTPYPEDQLSNFLACQVTDTGGIDDKSFNATAWKGVQDAVSQYGIQGQFLESQQQTDYERNIQAFLDQGCNIIITVGFLLGDATQAAAEANPQQPFSIVDFAYDPTIPNVLGQVFNTDQAAFLAGYVAAAATQTGTVGTFGGLQIPTVTVFMDGFVLGVRYYNEQNGTNVQALGWDPEAQTGLFVGNFESTDDGRRMGESLMDEGADIIMPVAGPVGLGTAAAAQQRGNVYIIGVDNDWTQTAPEYTDIVLTSVLKKMDVTTLQSIESVMNGTFEGGVVVGTLENQGVDIAPFYDLASLVPEEAQSELDTLRQGIISGDIQTSP
jgi:basic membrane protein A